MRLVMMGTGGFAEPTFRALIANNARHPVVGLVTQPDRIVGQQRSSTRQTGTGMKGIAQEHGIPIFQPQSINTPEGIEGLKALRPDLLVVAAYGQILSKEVLEVPPHGGINVHASLLPKYRGAAPIAWAIYQGETETGVSIIRMSPRLDAGDILAREVVPIAPEETAGELELSLAAVGAQLAGSVIEQLASGPVRGTAQDKALATKAPKLSKEHGAIDWTRDARQIWNHIRAMQPWPTAYTFLQRSDHPPVRLIIWKAVPATVAVAGAAPGDGVSGGASSSHLLVAAGGDTVVEILELQPETKRRMTAVEFLRGHPWQPGDRFGPASA